MDLWHYAQTISHIPCAGDVWPFYLTPNNIYEFVSHFVVSTTLLMSFPGLAKFASVGL